MSIDYDFNKKGYVFLGSVFDQDVIQQFNDYLKDFMVKNEIYTHIKKRHDVAEAMYFINNTYTAVDTYQKIQYYYLPVIDNRGSRNRTTDVGMIDIYNVHKLLPDIYKYFDITLLTTILNKITGGKWKFLRNNVQICSSVINPSSFHFENIEKCIKVIIYLSDVINNDYGPPVYVEESHINKNNIKNEKIKTFLGNKGDILISFQNGLHRKLPQNNTTVGFLVFNFIEVK